MPEDLKIPSAFHHIFVSSDLQVEVALEDRSLQIRSRKHVLAEENTHRRLEVLARIKVALVIAAHLPVQQQFLNDLLSFGHLLRSSLIHPPLPDIRKKMIDGDSDLLSLPGLLSRQYLFCVSKFRGPVPDASQCRRVSNAPLKKVNEESRRDGAYIR